MSGIYAADLERLDAVLEPMLRAARIPGAALAIVAGEDIVFARGYGYRDLGATLPLTANTLYPIASTTKAINATLLGMLVDDGKLAWDAPVRRYLPRFRLQDPQIGDRVTLRDLLTMRTGLPGHEFVWLENPITRADLVECMAHLPLSAGFRERFQYSDLTPTIAGHIAEIVSGESWEDLIRKRILAPLGMSDTGFVLPAAGEVTGFFHETHGRELVATRCFEVEPIGPAGGSIYSTVQDMTRWIAFNLNGGKAAGRQLIQPCTLKEIHSSQMVMGADPASPSPDATYGLGWFVDTYNGKLRISHTGHLHDVHSSVMLFPQHNFGMVSFVNFAASRLATLINEQVGSLMMDLSPAQTVEEALAKYERKVKATAERNRTVHRVQSTAPSHRLDDYTGHYLHAGYGLIEICQQGGALSLVRNHLVLPLEHWHYDAWAVAQNNLFEIHKPHPFDRASCIVFETDADGAITSFSIPLEPTVPPARFVKQLKN